ncbi:MAG: energy transducer TonB [Terriglobales bacterium]
MDSGLGASNKTTSPRAAEPQLRLLTELPPWRRVFVQNLHDKLLRREVPRIWVKYPPAKFWGDVFVPTGFPWLRMTESGVLHVLAVLMLVTFTDLYFSLQQQHTIRLKPQTAITDYEISEYLPPINTGSPPAPKARKGQPLLAKQQIISLPPRPDNFEQTIISPVDVKLPSHIPLPNIVAWTAVPAPLQANALRNETKLTVPQLPTNVIAPPPDARELVHSRLPDVASKVIGPAPEAQPLTPDRKLDVATNVIGPPATDDPKLRTPRQIIAITPAVIGPPPDANVSRNLGAINVGKLTPTVAAPRLEVAEQRAIPQVNGGASNGVGHSGTGTATRANGAAPPPPPALAQGALTTGPAAGQLIALNLHPANITGPVSVPPGRRTGEFAAGPEGKPDAPGTPDVQGGGHGAGGNGAGSAGAGKGGNGDLPSGIVIGNVPGAPRPGSVVVAGTPQKATTAPKLTDAARQVLMAAARPPRIGEVPHDIVSDTTSPAPSKIEDKVFSGKKYYSMTLNMPNLASAGGSWIIRFAQLNDDKTIGELTAPVATTKVDPAYPAELIRDGVEGTVILYAVIHKDGTVGDVRVLRGLQGRLDENARVALLGWKFRPGTKNGQAIDLEAVVQIPYKSARLSF